MYSPFRHMGSLFWKRNPIHLTVFVTRRCNARCPFCFYHSCSEGEGITDELSLLEIRKISASMGRLLWLAFSGGEIFLRDDLADITNVFYENNKPAIILLSTNGTLTDRIVEQMERILKSCEKSTIVVKLSLDGPEPVHDALRGLRGAYGKVMRTYETLKRFLHIYPNFELGVNTVFCKANRDAMGDTLHIIRGMDHIKTHTVSLFRGNTRNDVLSGEDIEAYSDTVRKLETDIKRGIAGRYRFRGSGLKAAQDILQRRLIHKTAVERKRPIPCYAGRLNIVLTETGDIYTCESFENTMGNVREWDYDALKFLKTQCARTAVETVRMGECYCTNECYMMTNILFNPLLIPAVLREYVKARVSGFDRDRGSASSPCCPVKDSSMGIFVPNGTGRK